MHRHVLEARGDDGVEDGADLRRSGLDEGHCAGLEEEVQRPASDDTIVRGDYQRDGYGQDAGSFPEAGAGAEAAEGLAGVAAAASSYHHFGEEHRKRNDKGAEHIHDDKGGPTVLPYHIREAPDVAKADGRARHRQNHGNAAPERLSFQSSHNE